MKNIIFIAPPAAGKGTQSQILKERYNYVHLSTGDMLRHAIESESELGLLVKNIMESGKLVSDDIMIDLIKNELTKIDGKPFILDGFPRTLNQAKHLDKLTHNYEVIYLNLSEEEALSRIENRLTCKCGKSYNLIINELKPKIEGLCDNCNQKLIKRSDDNKETFKIRYESFLENTKPLIKYYEEENKLHIIDVNKNVEDIFKDIMEVCNDKY